MEDEAQANVEPQAKRGVVLAGRYQLTRALDTGGMSSVWLAHDTSLDVDVAIKLVRMPRRSKDKEFARELAVRLVHEARVAAQVRHPAIVSVIDVAETDWGQPFVVMELLSGEHLGTVIHRDGPLKAIEAVRLILPVVQGMGVAHEKGIIHRDLKPANIFLARADDGSIQPKLIDFGIAKSDRLDRLNLTKQGETMGSPAYMSPEQVRGEEADARSDVWGLSMTLYELVSGKLPFERLTEVASMLAISETEAETLAQLGYDEELSAIVARGMKKDPAERFQTLAELGGELNRFLQGHGISDDAAGRAIVVPRVADGGSERPLSIPGIQPRRREVGLMVVCGIGTVSLLTIALALRASFETPSDMPAQPIVPPTPAASEPEPEPVALPPPPTVTTPPASTPSAVRTVSVKKPTPAPQPRPEAVSDAAVPSEPVEPALATPPSEEPAPPPP